MTQYDDIFSPLRIKGIELPNRVVVPPMVQVRPITSPEGIAWYRRLADGGPGMIIVEATGVPGFGDDLTAETLRPLVDVLHSRGAAAIQLFPIDFGAEVTPDELSGQQIDAIVDRYGRAVQVCREAGFDGVEPHGAHGYLLNQFFMPDVNHRSDAYGGSLENRCRLAERIVERVCEAAGDGMLVLYRHTPAGEAYTMADSIELARRLVAAGVDVLDISPARGDSAADLAAPFKAAFEVPVIAVGGMQDPDEATRALRAGRCDLIAVGRQSIADAQWLNKVREGRLSEVVACNKCGVGCFEKLSEGETVECVQWADDELAAYGA